ncbi:MAG TPA: hemerythrin domain-containing protein [Acidimicrobiales bacterium]|nr:hemerythrin domain-containing protein [Acidimicrobiales bacterium]
MPDQIIAELRKDHDEVRSLLSQIDSAPGDQKKELFAQLVGELIRHEVAEEEILRPVSKRDAGEDIADARTREESQAEELLKEMEKLDASGPEFTQKFAKLRTEVERHAAAEETEEFPKVEKGESTDRLERMGKAYLAAKAMAPTRPHPSTPNSAAANLLVGPFAAVVDRARDAVRKAVQEG